MQITETRRDDQIAMLKACRDKTDNDTPIRLFTYPDCGWDLVLHGLVNEDTTITKAGRLVLFLLGEGDEPDRE